MMYYDRSLPETMLALLAADGPLSWMGDLARELPSAHVQFRRATGRRRHGGIQFYVGRTSPLEVLGTGSDQVELTAHRSYRDLTPELFEERIPTAKLPSVRVDMEAHVRTAAAMASSSFIDGEAVAHAGMMRRYGFDYVQGDPFLALDSEVRFGFDSQQESDAFTVELRKRLRLPGGESLPKKLDAVGVLPDGDIALVEVKSEKGDLARAATQVAAHVAAFTLLAKQEPGGLSEPLSKLVRQKAAVRLLPDETPAVAASPRIVPVIAAPNSEAEWLGRCRKATAGTRKAHPSLLRGLRFWRLSAEGCVEEDEPA